MNIKTILICLMMATVSFAGCLGNNSAVITEEGDPVTPGELPDDWPTYYVATVNDLPTCDANTLGRLYYVEDQSEFQVCKAIGWEVINLGNHSSNFMINSPPIMKVRQTMVDDDLISPDGDGTFSINMGFAWNATDSDGTITTLGVDYNGDLSIDYILLDNPSMGENIVNPGQNGQFSNFNGFIPIPFEEGISVFRWADSISTEYTCSLSTNREITFIAIDDDGAVGTNTLMFDGLNPSQYSPEYITLNWDLIELETLGLISQADVDWLTGADPTSPCPIPTTEICDGVDNDLDGNVDEDWDFYTDNNNCGGCNVVCPPDSTCDAGICILNDNPPTVSNVILTFNSPHYICDYDFFDAENDLDQSVIIWYFDGLPSIDSSSNIIHKIDVEQGVVISCGVDARSQSILGLVTGNSLISQNTLVRNTPPSISNPVILPSNPEAGDTVTCSYEFHDDDGDSDQSSIIWEIDGVNMGGATSGIIEIPLGTPGDAMIFCSISPFDGEDPGDPWHIDIWMPNSIPEVLHIQLGQHWAGGDLIFDCDVDVYDKNHDTLSYQVEWYVDGAYVLTKQGEGYHQDKATTDELNVLNSNNEIQCKVVNLDDGFANNVEQNSNTIYADL